MKNWRVVFSLGAMLVSGFGTEATAATRTAASCSREAVATAIDASANGDIVIVPSGTCQWTQSLAIEKAITLQGQGVGKTVILDSIPRGSSPMSLMAWTLVPNMVSRLTGFEFRPGGRTTDSGVGLIQVVGSNVDGRRFRLDHCQFTELWSRATAFFTVLGVVDHNTLLIRDNFHGGFGAIKHSNWNGQNFGDGAWASGNQFGTDQFLFFEDNTITYLGSQHHITVIDAQAGGRYVFRYNTVSRGSVEGHGTESGGRERAVRAVEVYNNTFIGSNKGQVIAYFRGGVGRIHSNTMSDYQQTNATLYLLNNRNADPFAPWGGADGTNSWDRNTVGPVAAGKVLSAGSLTVSTSGSSWATNQWAGYAIRRLTNVGGVSGNSFSEITGNTSNTLTFRGSIYGQHLKFTSGDAFEIRKVEHALDQPGRSGGALVSGTTPTLPAGWTQVTDPWYEWNNTRDGGIDVDFIAIHGSIRQNEHYFDDRAPAGYQPYTYPHPLTLGIAPDGSAPDNSEVSAPLNLRLVP